MPRRLTEQEQQQFLADLHIAVLSLPSDDERPPLAFPIDALERVFDERGDQIAAFITVPYDWGEVVSKAFLERARALADRYGVDALRWWLLSEVAPVGDTDFTAERLVARADRDLAELAPAGLVIEAIGRLRPKSVAEYSTRCTLPGNTSRRMRSSASRSSVFAPFASASAPTV